MDPDLDHINFGFERMKIALNLKLKKENVSSKQLILILKHLLILKESVESDLKDKSKISTLILKLFRNEDFQNLKALVPTQKKSKSYNTLKKYEETLLLSFNDTNMANKFGNNFSYKQSEIKESFKIFGEGNILYEFTTPIEWCSDLFFKKFTDVLNHKSPNDFINGINTLLKDSLVDKNIPIVVGVYSIIFSYGSIYKFNFFSFSDVFLKELVQKVSIFIQTVLLRHSKNSNIELCVFFGFLRIEKLAKSIFEFYIFIKEQVLPTKILFQVKEYLMFWKDEEIQNVLKNLQNDKSLDQFLTSMNIQLPSMKRSLFSEMSQLFHKSDFIVCSYANKSNEIKFKNKICRKDVYSVDLFYCQSGEVNKSCARGKHINFLKQLLALTYNCKNLESIKKTENKEQVRTIEDNSNNNDNDDDDDGFPKISLDTIPTKTLSKKISDADLVQEVLSFCDDFLLQDVYEKMASCQLAVPIVSPKKDKNIFHLWATRTVKKKWVSCLSYNENHEKLITKQKMATISFCRIRSTSVSKSKIANMFLSSANGRQEHSYFINRDIDSESILNRGCIESCWYCPDGRLQEHLKDIHCIYNLRGNALKSKEQFQFLLNVSSVIVIIVEKSLEKEEREFIKLMDGYIVVVDFSHAEYSINKAGNRCFLGALNMNIKNLSEKLNHIISSFKLKVLTMEDHADHAFRLGMEIDENNEACQLGKKAAQDFIDKLQFYEIKKLKESVLPLQGKDLWINWSKQDEAEIRQHNLGQESPMKFSDRKRSEKSEIRMRQFEKGASSELIFFIERLLLFKNTIMQHYFITWCQMSLNEMSETHLPQMLKDYNSSKKKLSDLNQLALDKNCNEKNVSEPNNVQRLIDQEKKKIKMLSEDFSTVSFGCEHIFREFGQLYESHMSQDSKCVSFLPKLMADIVLMGYPFEILDGDASHAPVIWVKQVLFEVTEKLSKDIDVFVLSALGIQSSGKSTLLNTMFGSKFAVSSGRCTKGVYIHLIPVSSNLSKNLNCDYFIVMDSEGLRSPELTESYNHDNELATFIACLSNTTIINFMGQTFSKDMSDILEITLHAYIRMKKVQIKSSCHMVFAGVSDITARDKNSLGIGKVFGELNTLIEKIAIEEGRDDLFGGLSSVFPLIQEQFDQLDLTQKIDFPELLPSIYKGNMDPPESRYGEIVQQLRDSICYGMMKNYNNTLKTQPLTEFILRFNNLWIAIKQENFVFGFKNRQALQLFKKLQHEYEIELSKLRKKFYEASYHLTEELLHQIDTLKEEEELKKFSRKFNDTIIQNVTCWKESVKKTLEVSASKMSDAELALSYLPLFSYDMDRLVISWIDNEETIIKDKIILSCRKEKTAFMKKEEFKKKCLIKAREVAGELNIKASSSNLNSSVIKATFRNIFENWIMEATVEDEKMHKSTDSLLNEIWYNLIGKLYEHLKILNENISNLNNDIENNFKFIKQTNDKDSLFKNIPLESKNIVYIGNNWYLSKDKKRLPLIVAMTKRDEIIQKTKDILHNYEKMKSSSYAAVISQILESALKILSDKVTSNSDFEFEKSFKIQFLTKIFAASVKYIAYFEADQLQKNSLYNYLKSKECDMFKEFNNECLAVNSDVCQGNRFINDILCPIVLEEIKLNVGYEVMNEITKKFFFSTKENMIYYIHQELLNAPFNQLMNFLGDYNSYVNSWIEKKVASCCLHNEFLKNCITKKIKSTIECFSNILRRIGNDNRQMNLSSWWKKLDENLKSQNYNYQFSLNDASKVLQKISDFNYISGQIADKFLEYELHIFELLIHAAAEQENLSFNEPDVIAKVLEWFVFKPINDLKEKRIGCTAQCPMCGAICLNTVSCEINDSNNKVDYKHRNEIHMPQGMIGVYNVSAKTLVSDICSSLIGSDTKFRFSNEDKKKKYGITHDQFLPYKEYQKIIYDWQITVQPQACSTSFWQYLYVKHQTDLAQFYNLNEADDIPSGWRKVTAKEALDNLKSMYGIFGNFESDFNGETNASANDTDLCIICLNNPKDKFCLVPCGHACYCRTCVTKLINFQSAKCPQCRASITGTHDVYS